MLIMSPDFAANHTATQIKNCGTGIKIPAVLKQQNAVGGRAANGSGLGEIGERGMVSHLELRGHDWVWIGGWCPTWSCEDTIFCEKPRNECALLRRWGVM